MNQSSNDIFAKKTLSEKLGIYYNIHHIIIIYSVYYYNIVTKCSSRTVSFLHPNPPFTDVFGFLFLNVFVGYRDYNFNIDVWEKKLYT